MKLFLKSVFVEYFSRIHYKVDGCFPATGCQYTDSNVGSNHCRDNCQHFISKNSRKKYVCCEKKLLDFGKSGYMDKIETRMQMVDKKSPVGMGEAVNKYIKKRKK
jgi:hypothetical protein